MPMRSIARPTMTAAIARCESRMSEGSEQLETLSQTVAKWAEFWQSAASSSSAMGETWSKSVLPFVLARAAENRSGAGNAVAARPWTRAAELYGSTLSSAPGERADEKGWREQLGTWNAIANDELIRN